MPALQCGTEERIGPQGEEGGNGDGNGGGDGRDKTVTGGGAGTGTHMERRVQGRESPRTFEIIAEEVRKARERV